MTAATDPTLAALLRAVLDDPGDDLPRLAYADRLDELGDAARAEFIRVQLDLVALPSGVDDPRPSRTIRLVELRRRERELFVRQYGGGDYFVDAEEVSVANDVVVCHFRRGFVDEIALSLADFLANAAALFSSHPVTRVRLTDREPLQLVDDESSWFRRRDGNILDAVDLPAALADALDGYPSEQPAVVDLAGWISYPTADAARDALSVACVRYGRGLAGLPPLGEKP